jgi:hypothetical protein
MTCPIVINFQVMVTEVLGGGKFYVQTVGDQKIASIQQQLASLSLQEAPIVGAFNPKKGDIVLAQFSADSSWNRAMVGHRYLSLSLNYFLNISSHMSILSLYSDYRSSCKTGLQAICMECMFSRCLMKMF